VSNFEDLDRELAFAQSVNILAMIEVKCAVGARDDLGRPTTNTVENKVAFMNYLQEI